MPKLSLNDLTVLGLVAENRELVTGQQLEQIIENRGMRAWTSIGTSSIYYALRKLEEKEYVTSEKRTAILKADSPPVTRILYQTTPHGFEALRDEVKQVISQPARPIDPFDVALANWRCLSKDEFLNALESRLNNLKERESFLTERASYYGKPDAVEDDLDKERPEEHLRVIRALFERPLASLRAKKHWLKGFVEEMR
jgi:DNA-binding PadR family transcriptional regulator